MDIRLHRATTPALAARGELYVDAALRAAHDAGAPGRRILKAEHQHRIAALEEVRVLLHEFAQADVHALFIPFRDDDQVHGQLAQHGFHRSERVVLGHLGPLGVHRATAYQYFAVVDVEPGSFAVDELAFERGSHPVLRLRDRHRVVHPIEDQCLGRTLITFRIDDGVAGRAVLGNAYVVYARLLAAELVEESFDHLGTLGDALAAIGDAGLADPLLQVLDVLIDVGVDVREDLLQVRRDLAHIHVNGFIPMRAYSQPGCAVCLCSGRRRRLLLITARRRQHRAGQATRYRPLDSDIDLLGNHRDSTPLMFSEDH